MMKEFWNSRTGNPNFIYTTNKRLRFIQLYINKTVFIEIVFIHVAYRNSNRSRHCSTNSGFGSVISPEPAIEIKTLPLPPLSNKKANIQLMGEIHQSHDKPCSEKKSQSCYEVTAEDKFGHAHKTIQNENNPDLDNSNCVCPISAQVEVKLDESNNTRDEATINTITCQTHTIHRRYQEPGMEIIRDTPNESNKVRI